MRLLLATTLITLSLVSLPLYAEEVEPIALPETLHLVDAQRMGIANNPSLKAAGERIEQARARTLQAASVYYPQVTGGVSVAKTRFSQTQLDATRAAILASASSSIAQQISQLSLFGLVGGGSLFRATSVVGITTASALDVDETSEVYTANITASWLLFDGFQREFNFRAARIARKESDAAYREGQRMLLAAIAGAYYQAQLARENMEIADADKLFNERLLKDAEARQRVGTGSLSDVLNFRVQMNRALASYIDATRAYEVARIGLAELIVAPDGMLPATTELGPLDSERPGEMMLPDAATLLDHAYDARPDLEQTRLAVKRADSFVKARRGSYLPTAALSVSHDASSVDEWDIDGDDWTTTFGLSVTYTFFNGGRRWAEVREAKSLREEIRWTDEALRNQATREVHVSMANLRAAQQSLILQRSNAELAERNRELVEKGYEAGQDSLVRLTQAERDFTAARVQLAVALVSLRSAWHDLRTATAETLEAVENW